MPSCGLDTVVATYGFLGISYNNVFQPESREVSAHAGWAADDTKEHVAARAITFGNHKSHEVSYAHRDSSVGIFVANRTVLARDDQILFFNADLPIERKLGVIDLIQH